MSLQDRAALSSVAPANPPLGLPRAVLPAHSLARALVETAREPMAVLDRDFRVLAANRAYYRLIPAAFSLPPASLFREPVASCWNEEAEEVLKAVLRGDRIAEDVEIELDGPPGARRRLLLNARRTGDNADAALLIGLQDVAALGDVERLAAEAASQQDVLLQEAHHRIANSLQIIASILLLKARSVTSEETRVHLRDVHKRIILMSTVQRQLCSAGMLDEIEFGPYVAQLCSDLAGSVTEGDGRVAIQTSSSPGTIKSDDAISFGLIVTELVINSLKHGYPDERHGCIAVGFAAEGKNWRLSVSDDGVGRLQGGGSGHAGLGTNIVDALARHLRARVEVGSGGIGASTTIAYTDGAPPHGA